MNGASPSVFSKGGKEYDILLKSNISSISALEVLEITSSITGAKVILKEIAQIPIGLRRSTPDSMPLNLYCTLYTVKSFLFPFVIIITIPLGIMGSLLGLSLMGNPLSLTALFGIIALSGIKIIFADRP